MARFPPLLTSLQRHLSTSGTPRFKSDFGMGREIPSLRDKIIAATRKATIRFIP
jgi:hypothetical protein